MENKTTKKKPKQWHLMVFFGYHDSDFQNIKALNYSTIYSIMGQIKGQRIL